MSKKDIIKHIIEEYGVTSPTDIINALKDLLGETLQEMMDTEFHQHRGIKKRKNIARYCRYYCT